MSRPQVPWRVPPGEGARALVTVRGDDLPGVLAVWAAGDVPLTVGPGAGADLVLEVRGGLAAVDPEHAGELGGWAAPLTALRHVLAARGRRACCTDPAAATAAPPPA